MRAPYIRIAVLLFTIAMPRVVAAAVPEGLDNFAVFNKGSVSSSLSPLIQYTKPAWASPYSMLEVIASTPVGDNLFTFGSKVNVGSAFGDRDGYLLRYDWIVGGVTSVSFKWTHEDWKYISTSKDSFGLEYNYYLSLMDKIGIYGSLGGYYRYIKQRWNNPWWSPFNYNTQDKEYYFTGILGWKHGVGKKSFYTFDINIRDPWSYYNLDHVAFDLNIYINGSGGNFFWRLNGGTRTSALWMGTAYFANYYGGIGFVVY